MIVSGDTRPSKTLGLMFPGELRVRMVELWPFLVRLALGSRTLAILMVQLNGADFVKFTIERHCVGPNCRDSRCAVFGTFRLVRCIKASSSLL